MAYNNFPMGYQPYYPQNNPQNNYNAQQNNLIWVQGEAAAKAYPVAPNTSVPLWDSEANVIYIKSADMSGMPNIKVLDYTVRDNVARAAEITPEMSFATKSDLQKLEIEISALKAELGKEPSDAK